jgi:WhiB family redox-sensing transcriptional regulator
VPDWSTEARCLDLDPELFFPTGDGKQSVPQIAVAQQICSTCPVKLKCLKLALATDAQYGIWGGTTPKERARLRRRADISRNRRTLVVVRSKAQRELQATSS